MNLIIEIKKRVSANNVTSFAVNAVRTIYQNLKATKEEIQNSLINTLAPLYEHLRYAVTLTMKKVAVIAPKGTRIRYRAYLNESVARDQLRYFIKRLQHYAYGADAKRTSTKDKCIPIVIPAIDGGGRSAIDRDKRMHLHLAIGNLPEMSLAEARAMILRAWKDCDFAYKENYVTDIYDVNGCIEYITKGLLFGDSNVIELDYVTYPKALFKEIKYLQINESTSALELC